MTDFVDAVPPDTTPELSDVEYACRVCGKEAGPYGGRGPKPKYCPDHKKGNSSNTPRASKVSGTAANLAGQATASLVQLNGMIALGAMAMGMNDTASAIADANTLFEERAFQALLTDTELCKLILKSGAVGAKMGLFLAYGGVAAQVAPTAILEIREKKTERDAKREDEENASRT